MKNKHKHCLLVVDDEEDLVHSVKDLLRYDFRVLGTTRATEGLKIMEREQVHIVMSDQCMPEMTGVEFLSNVRVQFPDTVRLLFTAYADIKAVINAINQGHVYRYITKPWEPQDLQTVLKQASEHFELLMERKRLLAELQAKNEELQSANIELRHANELKKAFIKVASHELRTPLTIVMGLAELAHTMHQAPSPLDEWIERIHVGSQRLNERVDLLIKLLMADKYERQLTRAKVNVRDLIHSTALDVRTFVEQRKQEIKIAVPDNLGEIFIEEDKIRDSLLQLLVNAIKFTPDGGAIGLAAERLTDDSLVIRVSDTGIGMDKENLAKIFDPFFTRFDVSRHSSGVCEFDRRGLGLGLSVVKAFVEMHGGQIKVESQVGEGSTFSIVLPEVEGHGNE